MVDYERLILGNGLRVILHRDELTPLVAVNLLFQAGSKFDPPQKSGLAHLFEHLMFAGTPRVPDFDEPIQMAGAENNAFTNSDYADYYSYGPYQNLETLLWLEADRLANLQVTSKAFKTQQKVVIEELHESCLNEPYGDIWHHLLPAIYKNHPYRWPTIGLTAEEIGSIKLKDIKGFYRQYYNAENCILSIAGNLNINETKKLVEKYFSQLPISPASAKNFDFNLREYRPRKIHIQSDVPVPAFYLVFPMVGRTHPDYYVLDLLSDLLALGRSSLFYKKLIKESEVLAAADAYITGTHDTGLFMVEGKLSQGVTYENAIDQILEIIEQVKHELVEDRIMEKLKNGLESSVVFSETSTLSKAMNLAYYELIGDVELINSESEKYQMITATDLQRVTNTYLDQKLMTVLYYEPRSNE
ncbi:MAG: insulinase family protein [Saprospiraceae bacterium]|nr:insulinase family protein [Saprospiraceae bacterium]